MSTEILSLSSESKERNSLGGELTDPRKSPPPPPPTHPARRVSSGEERGETRLFSQANPSAAPGHQLELKRKSMREPSA